MQEKPVLAVIPARKVGAKVIPIPEKNIREFAGKPLIVHSTEASLKCSLVNRTAVCTDDDKIAEVAQAHGAQDENHAEHHAMGPMPVSASRASTNFLALNLSE